MFRAKQESPPIGTFFFRLVDSRSGEVPPSKRFDFHPDRRRGNPYWAQVEPSCGLWATPEARVRVLPDRIDGMRTVERYSPLYALCASSDGQASTTLSRGQFGLNRLHLGNRVEFVLPHGEMFRLLRGCGFVVEDLIEIQAPRPARDYAEVSAATRWTGRGTCRAPRSRRRPRRYPSDRPTSSPRCAPAGSATTPARKAVPYRAERSARASSRRSASPSAGPGATRPARTEG